MSTPDNAVQQVLRTAIQREIDAHNLYNSAVEIVDNAQAKEMLKDLAAQELGHRAKLESLLAGRVFRVLSGAQQKQVEDLRITDYLVEAPLTEGSDFQDVLIVAGKRENASHELYSALAEVADDEDTKQLFSYLATEELTHKRRVETLYDQIVYREN